MDVLSEKDLAMRCLLFILAAAVFVAATAFGWWIGRGAGAAFVAFVIVVFSLLMNFPPHKVQSFVSAGLVPLTALAFLGTGLAIGFSETTGTVRFYEISAQVIPTLVLALALEIRLVSNRIREPFTLVFPTIILLAVGLGEFAALKAVLTGRPTQLDFQSVVVALVTAFVGVFLGALAHPPSSGAAENDVV